MIEKYHKYVFNTEERSFVGQFEEMYHNENIEGFDSWHQEDVSDIRRQICLTILSRYNFKNVLDIGCGKGNFTNLLKKVNNHVTGIDISQSAIGKANIRYRNLDFMVASTNEWMQMPSKQYDLITIIGTLTYIENWRDVVKCAVNRTRYLYVDSYVPNNPIGYVKSFDEFHNFLSSLTTIETEVLVNRETIIIFGKTNSEYNVTVPALASLLASSKEERK